MAAASSKSLEGKIALVTGGAKRLGRAAALRLAEAGADVGITFLRSSKEAQKTLNELKQLGVRAEAVRCDVTDPKSIRSAMASLDRKFGRLDILVNNAGRYETVLFEDITIEQW